jgi:hypothetical protein
MTALRSKPVGFWLPDSCEPVLAGSFSWEPRLGRFSFTGRKIRVVAMFAWRRQSYIFAMPALCSTALAAAAARTGSAGRSHRLRSSAAGTRRS